MIRNFLLRYFVPLNILYDILANNLWERGVEAAKIRGILLLLIILPSLIIKKYRPIYKPFLIFSIYILILLNYVSVFSISLQISSKILINLWIFPLMYVYSYLYTEKIIFRNIAIISILLISNYMLSSYFGWGESTYAKDGIFLMGSLKDAWFIFTFTLFLYIAILKYNGKIPFINKILYLLMFSFLFVLLIVGLKRSAILLFFFGFMMYLYFEKFKLKTIFVSILVLIISLVMLEKYSSIIDYRIEGRGDRISSDYKSVIITEPRYLETIFVWEEILSFKNINKSIFGLEAFHSAGKYANGIFGDRVIHLDYNLIVYTTGLFGLFLYLYIIYFIYKQYKRDKQYLEFKYKEIFLIFFICQIIASFSQGLEYISYASLKFTFMAVALNKYKNEY